MSPRRRNGGARVSAVLLMAVHLAGCTAWQTQRATPAAVLAEQPSRVRLMLNNGARVVLASPVLRNDSVVGTPTHMSRGAPVTAIPVSDIEAMAVSRVSAGRTIALVAGIGATALLVMAASEDEMFDGGGGGGGGGETPTNFSCPLVYSWDGDEWRLDSGTFGGAIARAFARADIDNLVFARPIRGRLRLRLANELQETDYVNQLVVLAVDHDSGMSVAPGPDGSIHLLRSPVGAVSAHDFGGRDVLARVAASDEVHWETRLAPVDTTGVPADGIELAFARPVGSSAHLVLDARNTAWSTWLMGRFVAAHGQGTQAWYDSLDAHPEFARSVREGLAKAAFLRASVLVNGAWVPQGILWEAGPEISKRQVLELDLSAVRDSVVRIRLDAPPAFWSIDFVGLEAAIDDRVLALHTLEAATAVDRHGRDVRGLLAAVDTAEYVLETGDAADLEFVVPPDPAAGARTYLLRTHGWYRIQSPETGKPQVALLRTVLDGRGGLARAAALRFNAALLAAGRRPR